MIFSLAVVGVVLLGNVALTYLVWRKLGELPLDKLHAELAAEMTSPAVKAATMIPPLQKRKPIATSAPMRSNRNPARIRSKTLSALYPAMLKYPQIQISDAD